MGRYLNLTFQGRPHRIYFEEAGQGTPLICLHTAGSDGRQYREILNDEAITANCRVVVFDLPWHGKSSPPAGFQDEIYELTTDGYVAIVMAVKQALGLDNSVIMGCAIGGRAVLHLALRHGKELRAVIGQPGSGNNQLTFWKGPVIDGSVSMSIVRVPIRTTVDSTISSPFAGSSRDDRPTFCHSQR